MKQLRLALLVLVIVVFSPATLLSAPAQSLEFQMVNPTPTQLKQKISKLAPKLNFQVDTYLRESNLTLQKPFKPLFTPQFSSTYLRHPASYREVVSGVGDRLKITRTIELDFKDPCDPSIPPAQSFCFKKTSRPFDKNVAKDLQLMRSKMRKQMIATRDPQEKERIQRLLSKSDDQLLDYVLNKSQTKKTITQTSTLPLVPVPDKVAGRRIALPPLNAVLPRLPAGVISPQKLNSRQATPYYFDNTDQYRHKIVTGYRYHKNYEDTYVVTFAKKTRFTDRYYASFSWWLTLDFGFQFPFELSVDTEVQTVHQKGGVMTTAAYPANELCPEAANEEEAYLCSKSGVVKLQARAVPGGESNIDFYEAAGVPKKLLREEEFIFDVEASCEIYVSVPGKDIDGGCPKVGKNLSRSFTPALGSKPVDIKPFYLSIAEAKSLGFGFFPSPSYFALRPGVSLQGRNGWLNFRIRKIASSLTPDRQEISLNASSKSIKLAENVQNGTRQWGLKLYDPTYNFTASLKPGLMASVGIGVASYDWHYTFGPYTLDALTFDIGDFSFTTLDGAPDSYLFIVGTRKED